MLYAVVLPIHKPFPVQTVQCACVQEYLIRNLRSSLLENHRLKYPPGNILISVGVVV